MNQIAKNIVDQATTKNSGISDAEKKRITVGIDRYLKMMDEEALLPLDESSPVFLKNKPHEIS